MIEIFNKDNSVNIKNSENVIVTLDVIKKVVKIDDYLVDYPWEYEKSLILLEVKEYEQKLFYSLLVEWKVILVIFDDIFEMKEDIMSFFWDVDILLIIWSKNSSKIVENIEARVVIPFWEWKDVFLNTLGQRKEEVDSFKLKSDSWDQNTEFINLK